MSTNRKDNLKFLIVADSINKFIKSDEYDWDKKKKIGWNTEEKENVLHAAVQELSRGIK